MRNFKVDGGHSRKVRRERMDTNRLGAVKPQPRGTTKKLIGTNSEKIHHDNEENEGRESRRIDFAKGGHWP